MGPTYKYISFTPESKFYYFKILQNKPTQSVQKTTEPKEFRRYFLRIKKQPRKIKDRRQTSQIIQIIVLKN